MKLSGLKYGVFKLLPGLSLIAALSFVLLFAAGEKKASGENIIKIAIFQFSSRPTLDDAAAAFIKTLAARGFEDGKNIYVKKFNAENDNAAGSAIAHEIIESNFDMAVTLSTPSLQIMAKANRDRKMPHLFGVVTDPAGAGVEIKRDGAYSHPGHLAGIGTFQPVEKVIELAKLINPGLKKIGTPWTLSEQCAEACVIKARKACAELGITLVESPVENSSSVLDASRALVLKGVEALWVGGDNVVETSIESVIKAGAEAGIPVFTNNPDHASKGAYVSLGADYYQVGEKLGELTASVLSGRAIKSVPIENVVPENLVINLKDNKNTGPQWKLPLEASRRAAKIIE
ncbi:MAG TPA: ABC transporter substrate-binding protein [Candidatus Wallbacteria bacterium]|nr:MAG: ABC transporter substrate binding protein [bacterium ADurb.Bin243]HOD39362.1 ABC transporter substrate-binding protein [Candidatus Wallbacteria bacterium]HPG58232.1 ABC transporter substrate-binding protein [Candidatus Wallbacteria bacterium]